MIRHAYWQTIFALCGVTLFCFVLGGFPFLLGTDVWRAYRIEPAAASIHWGEFFTPFLFVGFLLAGFYFLGRIGRMLIRPHSHPVYRQLAAFGPPAEVASAIERELADAAETVVIGSFPPVYLTPSWVLQLLGDGLHLVRLEDVLRVRRAAFLPRYARADSLSREQSEMPHPVEVTVRRGRDEVFGLSEADVHRFLIALIARAPWALVERRERRETGLGRAVVPLAASQHLTAKPPAATQPENLK